MKILRTRSKHCHPRVHVIHTYICWRLSFVGVCTRSGADQLFRVHALRRGAAQSAALRRGGAGGVGLRRLNKPPGDFFFLSFLAAPARLSHRGEQRPAARPGSPGARPPGRPTAAPRPPEPSVRRSARAKENVVLIASAAAGNRRRPSRRLLSCRANTKRCARLLCWPVPTPRPAGVRAAGGVPRDASGIHQGGAARPALGHPDLRRARRARSFRRFGPSRARPSQPTSIS